MCSRGSSHDHGCCRASRLTAPAVGPPLGLQVHAVLCCENRSTPLCSGYRSRSPKKEDCPVTTSRIAPLEPPYEPDTAALLAKWMPPGNDVEPLRLFRTLAVHDELASRMRPLGAGILGHPRLEPRERELLILRTCA